jgi:hypothetical protein
MADLIRNIEAQPRPWNSTLRCFAIREMMAAYKAQLLRSPPVPPKRAYQGSRSIRPQTAFALIEDRAHELNLLHGHYCPEHRLHRLGDDSSCMRMDK